MSQRSCVSFSCLEDDLGGGIQQCSDGGPASGAWCEMMTLESESASRLFTRMFREVFMELTCQCLCDFLVHNDIDLYSSLSRSLEHSVYPVLLILVWRTSQIQFGGQPPYITNISIALMPV